MIVVSLENLCLLYMMSARGLAGLDGGHIVPEGAEVEVNGQGGMLCCKSGRICSQ